MSSIDSTMVVPVGTPLAFLCGLRTSRHVERFAESDLASIVCARSEEHGLRHYFYGGKPGDADKVAAELKRRYPLLQIVGTMSQPDRPLTRQEQDDMIQRIASSSPDIVWVSLSKPQQDSWMRDHLGRIPGATMIGIGTGFGASAAQMKRVPRWMQRSGLEWIYDLATEPRRFWNRT